MSMDAVILDRSPRAKQKELSRARDAVRLQSGQVSPEQLKHENNFFRSLPIKRYKMVAIGGKPLRCSL